MLGFSLAVFTKSPKVFHGDSVLTNRIIGSFEIIATGSNWLTSYKDAFPWTRSDSGETISEDKPINNVYPSGLDFATNELPI